jgi:hypothetical protein
MRRQLMTLALAGLFGALLTSGEAQACHKRKCTPACAPAPTCAPAPVCAPAKKHCGLFGGGGHKMFGGGGLCHKKKAACAPAPCGPAPCEGPVAAYYPAPSPQASPQIHASGQ